MTGEEFARAANAVMILENRKAAIAAMAMAEAVMKKSPTDDGGAKSCK